MNKFFYEFRKLHNKFRSQKKGYFDEHAYYDNDDAEEVSIPDLDCEIEILDR